jgi:hypothetical protein
MLQPTLWLLLRGACCPVEGGLPWQDVQVMAAPVQAGAAVVAPPVKLPWQ